MDRQQQRELEMQVRARASVFQMGPGQPRGRQRVLVSVAHKDRLAQIHGIQLRQGLRLLGLAGNPNKQCRRATACQRPASDQAGSMAPIRHHRGDWDPRRAC